MASTLPQSKLRIIVTGYVGCVPVGGVAWDYLQYVVGLARMGHDVYYHEDTFKWPYHPLKKEQSESGEYSAKYIADFFKQYAPELSERWHYFHLREQSYGMTRSKFSEIARSTDLFLNISGSGAIPQELSPGCRKIFVDTDPGYNQIKMFQKKENTSKVPGFLRVHDKYFTYAENIHSRDCLVPKLDVEWKTTRIPIVLHLWESFAEHPPRQKALWNTIMTWSEFKDVLAHQGNSYGGKDLEFEKIMSLPQRMDVAFAIAVGGTKAPLERLRESGWKVWDGPRVTRTPGKYQQFIAKARGEISIAKNVYVALRTGWFSCRSACYLAAGRPVVLQNTGFEQIYPTGNGIRIFDDAEQAVNNIREIESNYDHHAKAAREIAVEHFDSDKVLQRLVQESFK